MLSKAQKRHLKLTLKKYDRLVHIDELFFEINNIDRKFKRCILDKELILDYIGFKVCCEMSNQNPKNTYTLINNEWIKYNPQKFEF
jgi:hypothetical protein